jgi:hypothetical protein
MAKPKDPEQQTQEKSGISASRTKKNILGGGRSFLFSYHDNDYGIWPGKHAVWNLSGLC